MNTDYKIKEPVNLERFILSLVITAFVKSVIECTFINWIANFAASTIPKCLVKQQPIVRAGTPVQKGDVIS